MGASPYHDALFFKFQSITVPSMLVLLDAFPRTPWIFVYRDPVQTMMSHFKKGVGSGPCLREQRSPRDATARVLGVEKHAASKTSKENYCAAHLAMLSYAAADAYASHPSTGLLVDYESLPGSLPSYVLPKHFGVPVAADDGPRIAAAGGVYSKARDTKKLQGEWEGDSEKKERASTPTIRDAAGAYLKPAFDKCRAATLAKTGGDDLVHLKGAMIYTADGGAGAPRR